MLDLISQAYYFGKDFAASAALAQKQVDAAIAAHQVPPRNTLDLLVSSQVNMKDEAGAERTMETLVQYYNDPNDWAQIIDVAMTAKGVSDVDVIWAGRLLFATGATVSPSDATLIGSDANHLTFYGDAQTANEARRNRLSGPYRRHEQG